MKTLTKKTAPDGRKHPRAVKSKVIVFLSERRAFEHYFVTQEFLGLDLLAANHGDERARRLKPELPRIVFDRGYGRPVVFEECAVIEGGYLEIFGYFDAVSGELGEHGLRNIVISADKAVCTGSYRFVCRPLDLGRRIAVHVDEGILAVLAAVGKALEEAFLPGLVYRR